MGIDLNKDYDLQVIRRLSNTEERIKDIFTAQSQFASSSEITELLSAMSLELATIKDILTSLERRVSIIEDNPDL